MNRNGGAHPYSREGVGATLRTERFGRDLRFFEVLESTQRTALGLASAGAAEGAVVLADEQTAGVGRRGRSWHSARGMGVWLSLVLRPRLSPRRGGILSIWAGLAALEMLRRRGCDDAGLRWPNDVLVGSRKICGVLIDAATVGQDMSYAVLGIGLNAAHLAGDFPDELRPHATSVRIETGVAPDRTELASDLLLELERTYALVADEEGRAILADRACRASVLIGRPVKVVTECRTVAGTALRVEPDGALVIADAGTGAEIAAVAGEVELVRTAEVEP